MPANNSPTRVVARWRKPSGATLELHANGALYGQVAGGRPTRIRHRAATAQRGDDYVWTLDDAEARAAEYGFNRDAAEAAARR